MQARIGCPLLVCLALAVLAQSTSVSLETLQLFFQATYDTNRDKVATLEEFVDYFRLLEPDHNVSVEEVNDIFKTFDTNNDNLVSLKELVELVQLKIRVHAGHKQVHLGFTGKEREMSVMWVSNPEAYNKPIVQFGRRPTLLNMSAEGTTETYDVGHLGFHGKIYRAVMKELQVSQKYYYRVGDQETQTFSRVMEFSAPPVKVQQLDQIVIAVFGDMGTFAPFGHMVAKQIAKDHFAKPFNFVFLTGDIAYAGMNSEKVGEFEPIWDLFGELTEGFAGYTAFMPGVGNHEKYYNYTSYMNRYVLPRHGPNQTNLWFSFDYAQLHVVHFSSEHPYALGSPQYDFLEKDLQEARDSPFTKWIIVGVHRSFYTSDSCCYHQESQLSRELQDLMNKYSVDIVQTGHSHCYERTWPTIRGKAMKEGQTEHKFIDPVAPIYLVQGTAGALINDKFVEPKPEWSIKRLKRYGYGRISIRGNSLKYQFVTAPTGRVIDEWTITKTK